MVNLTFGEQLKIVLSRKGMTIKELAEQIEEATGKKMSRQNLTQRIGRDNFQEQDMRMIAEILGCSFQLSILAPTEVVEKASVIEQEEPTEKELAKLAAKKEMKEERQARKLQEEMTKNITVGEFVDRVKVQAEEPAKKEEKEAAPFQPIKQRRDVAEDRELGEINPYTGREYQTNSVRTHPKRIGYVQVYDRKEHKWIEMTEWAFLGVEERRKAEEGKAYEPPIYLD